MEDNNLNNQSNRGGVRPGAGRKPGAESETTKIRRKALQEFRDRVSAQVHSLLDAQLNLAKGVSYMYRIDEIEKTGSNGKKYIAKEHVLVTDPEEIKHALDDDLVNGEDYYYITTKTPDNKALDSVLDRTFGRATQNIGFGEDDEGQIKRVEIEFINKHEPKNPSDQRTGEEPGSSEVGETPTE